MKKLADEREILKIDGHNCKLLAEWTENQDTYVLGQDIEDPTFYYAKINNKQEFEFDGANGAPSRDDVVSHYINYMSEQETNQHEAEYGADGRRAFPHLNDEPKEQIKLHIKYQEPVVMNGWRAETDTITFDSRENMEAFIRGNVAYDVLDNAIRKKDNEILLYAEDENGDVIWRTKEWNKELEDEKNGSINVKRFSEEEKFLLDTYKKYYEVSAPLIENNDEFFDIFRSYREDGTLQYEVKYNPLGFGYPEVPFEYSFMYISTSTNEYNCLFSFNDVKKYMNSEAIEKFETISEKVENIKHIMEKIPVHFYSDEKLRKMIIDHYDNEPTGSKGDFIKQVNDYVTKEQLQFIKMDLKRNGLKADACLVNKILELNKITKKVNTVEDMRYISSLKELDTKELLKDINKIIRYQTNKLFQSL